MTHQINRGVRDFSIALFLIAGLSLLGSQALLLEWRFNAGQESDIQARGPFIVAMQLPYIILVAGVLVAIPLAVVARSRRRPVLPLLSVVSLAVGGLLADLLISGGTILFAPVLPLTSVFGSTTVGLVGGAEILVGFLLLWFLPGSGQRGPALELQ